MVKSGRLTIMLAWVAVAAVFAGVLWSAAVVSAVFPDEALAAADNAAADAVVATSGDSDYADAGYNENGALVGVGAVTAQNTSKSLTGAKSKKKKLSKADKARKKRKRAGKPRIAIVNTTSSGGLSGWLRRAGCTPVVVRSVKVNIKKYDGMAIPGGGDVTPKMYKAKRNPNTYGTSLKRDRLQTRLVRKFAKANKPVLGVCRGNQVINVAFGGTLKQHIPGWHRGSRTVKIKKGTWLYKTYGKSESVSHYHHQCVKRLGKGLIATQWDKSSGLIEAIQHKKYPVWGVQWHPDHMGGRGLKVAKKFRRECLKRM